MKSRYLFACLAFGLWHCSADDSASGGSGNSGGTSGNGGSGGSKSSGGNSNAGGSSTSTSGGSSSGGSSSGGSSSGGSSSGGSSSGGSGGSGGAQTSWLDDPSEMPPTLEETGLYTDLSDLDSYSSRAVLYRPAYPLWTNGSIKQRFVVVPQGEAIDTTDRENWQFPENTLFFKTFSYVDEDAKDGLRPIETRVLKRTASGWEYHVYLWADDRSTAELLSGVYTTPVSVEYEGEQFDHVVPARLDCRKCHESQPVGAIGFDELRLNAPLEPGDSDNQLETLVDAGLLSDLPDDPDTISDPDPITEQVLGYLQGNCTHCHNGWTGPSSAFDMRHDVALENLINVDTTSELLTGVRVVPGSPDDSALYRALTRDPTIPNNSAMPPVGVDLVDREAVDLVYEWIENLEAN